MKLNKRELTIQRTISVIGVLFLFIGVAILKAFLDNPSYLTGIGWFMAVMFGNVLLIYREERLGKFAKGEVSE